MERLAAETYPATSAECEQSFSVMTETVWDKRNQMNPVSSPMFVKLNGVSVAQFNPYPYVRSWIAATSTSWLTGFTAIEKAVIILWCRNVVCNMLTAQYYTRIQKIDITIICISAMTVL